MGEIVKKILVVYGRIHLFIYSFNNLAYFQTQVIIAWSHKSHTTVDYTLIGVEPHGPTRGVWPIATVTNDSQSHLVASSI